MSIELYLIAIAPLFGLVFGSFANVVIYRLPLGLSIRTPNSYCPRCQTPLKSVHLVPVFSWVFLGRQCAFCHTPISARYPLVELLTAAIFWGMALRHPNLDVIFWCGLGLFLVCVAFIDADTQLIPDRLTICGAVWGLLFILSQVLQRGMSAAISPLLGALLGYAILYLVNLVSRFVLKKDGMGGGDMKLMAVCGLFLGIWGILWALYVGVLLGGAFAVYLLLTKKAIAGAYFAFGPFLCAGVLLVALFGRLS